LLLLNIAMLFQELIEQPALCLGGAFFVPNAFPVSVPPFQLTADVIMFVASLLMLLLAYFLYRGHHWARRVLIISSVCIIIAMLFLGISSVRDEWHHAIR
jgi:hypothetical protein